MDLDDPAGQDQAQEHDAQSQDTKATGVGGRTLHRLTPANSRGTSETSPADSFRAEEAIRRSEIVVDALIGYGLRGAPKGRTADLIKLCLQQAARVLSLDVPSGLNATTGDKPGPAIRPDRTLTLALPKTGLQSVVGDLYLADIGIPPEVYFPLGLSFEPFFGRRYWIPLVVEESS